MVSLAGVLLGILLGAGGVPADGLPLGGQALQTVVSPGAVTLAFAVPRGGRAVLRATRRRGPPGSTRSRPSGRVAYGAGGGAAWVQGRR